MKKIVIITFLLLLSNPTFTQSLMIYKTDQTSLSFDLSEIDSITISVTSLTKPLTVSNWECNPTGFSIENTENVAGAMEEVTEGLKIYGGGDQINQSVHLASIADNPVMQKTIYLKWKAQNDGDFMNVAVNFYADTSNWSDAYRMMNLNTDSSSDGSEVISSGTWYFTRIAIESNTIVSVTAAENYADKGGKIIQELSSTISEPLKTFAFEINANKKSFAVLGEVRIE
jgi:hypothetical protein